MPAWDSAASCARGPTCSAASSTASTRRCGIRRPIRASPRASAIDTLAARAANKAALQRRLGLRAVPDAVLLGVVSRLSWQKGLDLLLETLPLVVRHGMQVALLGAGDPDLQARYAAAGRSNPDQVGVVIGYDEDLAHLIQAGADALVVPSRFEPCGLTQLCALRYGAIPVVSRVGGLADTVIDANEMAVAAGVATGIQFAPVSGEGLDVALRRTEALFGNKPVVATDAAERHAGGCVVAQSRAPLCRALSPGRQEIGLHQRNVRPPSTTRLWPVM